MRRKTRTKVKKYLKISGIVIGILLFIIGIIFLIRLNKIPEISYRDGIVCKNYFCEITIDLNTKEVKRDNRQTSLIEEFNISKEREDLAFSSEEEMKNLLSDSVFNISIENKIFKITNNFQTKKILVQADEIKQKVTGQEISKLADELRDEIKEKGYIIKDTIDGVQIEKI